jgi:hypothetical protein
MEKLRNLPKLNLDRFNGQSHTVSGVSSISIATGACSFAVGCHVTMLSSVICGGPEGWRHDDIILAHFEHYNNKLLFQKKVGEKSNETVNFGGN